ncbi:hypothetical protein DL93DRAFT_224980 [Clavulina sp. PMI_390]|nr:hypothetical protein DL93DRAFT_224980 [Clavulina sp. PMI_390]
MEEPFPGPPRKREPSSTPAPIIPSYVKRESTPTPDPMVIDLSSSPDTPPRVKRENYAPTTPHRAHTMPEVGSSKSLFIDLTHSPPDRKPFDTHTPTAPRIAPPNFGQTSTPSTLRSPVRPPASRMEKIMAGLAAMDNHLETGDSDGSGPSPVDGTPAPAPINLKPTEPIVLSEEQQGILNAVLQGHSLFFTGSAGTGKSVLLREIISQLRARGTQVAVTASTGIASINVGGSTIHSFAGCGLAKGSKEELGKSVMGTCLTSLST